MKTEFQAKLLQHMVRKKENQGFTLIELLVVIIIIGILAAIALPSFLNQANKAKQSEAKTQLGAMTRAQQAFFVENNTFATNFDAVGAGIKTVSNNFTYATPTTTSTQATATATAKNTQSLKSYTGQVNIGQTVATGEATTISVLCETNTPSGTPPTATFAAGPPSTLNCASPAIEVTK